MSNAIEITARPKREIPLIQDHYDIQFESKSAPLALQIQSRSLRRGEQTTPSVNNKLGSMKPGSCRKSPSTQRRAAGDAHRRARLNNLQEQWSLGEARRGRRRK
jgi:hypothetical protein